MAKKAELKAVLSMDMSPFSRSAARALATGKALARQFARNPVKMIATGAFLGAEKAVRGMGSAFGNMAGRAGRAMTGLYAKIAAVAGVAGFAKGIEGAYAFGSELQDMHDRTGIAVEKLVVLTQALKDNGIEFGALVPAIKKMQANAKKAGF